MRNGLAVFLVSVIGPFSVSAYADPAPPDLRGLLTIGLSKPHANLQWEMGRAEVRSLFPGFSPTTFAVGIYSLRGAAIYHGCVFNLRLDSEISPEPEGKLKSVHADYKTGNLQSCRPGLESTLSELYGRPNITKHPAGWPDGAGPPATVHSDWQTATTCIDLWWEDGEGRSGPSMRLTLGDNGGAGCGGYEDQPVQRRLIK